MSEILGHGKTVVTRLLPRKLFFFKSVLLRPVSSLSHLIFDSFFNAKWRYLCGHQ